jgi:hypothetical protein
MNRLFAVGISTFLFCVGVAPIHESATQTDTVEYQVKAAFLYNFAKFVDWPPQAFEHPADPFTICVGNEALGSALETAIQGETLNGRRLTVRRTVPDGNVQGCHILYADASQSRYPALNAIKNSPILTVGETQEFINGGGMIRFIESGRRIQFQINAEAVERASLKLSSKLLRLAVIVRPKGGQEK